MFARATFILAALASGPAIADPIDLPVEDVLSLGEWAFADRDGFSQALRARLPSAVFDAAGQAASAADPFRWALAGHFGPEGASSRPGAIFGCARYGVATRDLFEERGFVHPDTFSLMGSVLPLHDDAEVWPEAAVARLHCIFIWDDAETVRIIPEAPARRVLSAQFETVTSDETGDLLLPLLGEGGFRLSGQNGLGDHVVWLESGDMILTNGHQQVSFRAFLIGGAV